MFENKKSRDTLPRLLDVIVVVRFYMTTRTPLMKSMDF